MPHTQPEIAAWPVFCREQGIDYAEMRFSVEEFGLGITNSRLDLHANPKGHELLLGKLREVLEERGLLPR